MVKESDKKRSARQKMPTGWRVVYQSISDDLRKQVDQEIVDGSDGVTEAKRIYDAYQLNQFQLTLAQFKKYVEYVCWRARLNLMGQVVGPMMPDGSAESVLPAQAAYLKLMGLILAALEGHLEIISMSELVQLSRALAEHRKINVSELRESRHHEKKKTNEEQEPIKWGGKIPDNVRQVIAQIYGVKLDGQLSGESSAPIPSEKITSPATSEPAPS